MKVKNRTYIRDRPIYRPTGIRSFEDRPMCEFELYNDKRCR